MYNKLVRMQGGARDITKRTYGYQGERGRGDFFKKHCVRIKWMAPYSDLLLFSLCNITAYK